jgi:hypothetical protein
MDWLIIGADITHTKGKCHECFGADVHLFFLDRCVGQEIWSDWPAAGGTQSRSLHSTAHKVRLSTVQSLIDQVRLSTVQSLVDQVRVYRVQLSRWESPTLYSTVYLRWGFTQYSWPGERLLSRGDNSDKVRVYKAFQVRVYSIQYSYQVRFYTTQLTRNLRIYAVQLTR